MNKEFDLFRCALPMDAASTAVLRNLREQGLCVPITLSGAKAAK